MKHFLHVLILAAFAAALCAQNPYASDASKKPAGPMPRANGKPDFQGVWEVPPPGGGAAFDVEDHEKEVYGIPPGKGVIIDPKDGKIPYLPEADAHRKDLVAHHLFDDPQAHCVLSGTPRQIYAPFGFTILQDVIVGLVKIEPWMIISYADSTIGSVFAPGVNWGLFGQSTTTTMMVGRRLVSSTTYTAGIAEGIVIMLAYLVITAAAGLWLFEREEFT